jgi:succinate-semialdehyde dehydrogenase / glutarate-semialdehyde dehydrogenase
MIRTTNPTTGVAGEPYKELTTTELAKKIDKVHTAYLSWKNTTLQHRQSLLKQLGQVLKENRAVYGAIITEEMGCPLTQTVAEIEKSAMIAELISDQGIKYLQPKNIPTDAKESYISYEPLGIVFHIAPWNYPFYLALRPVVAALMAGNCVLLKHASNVPQSALLLEEVFKKAGFPDGVFETLLISSSMSEDIIQDNRVAMVTLIGSDLAGSAVGAIAGKHIKKTLMELGGSDPMIIHEDADIEKVVKAARYSRLRNSGQSCNAAKRFIVHHKIHDDFVRLLKEEVLHEVLGDPMEKSTTMGPIATESARQDIHNQVTKSVEMGAKLETGGEMPEGKGYFYPATILTGVIEAMPVMSEEVFGPVIPIYKYSTIEEAVRVANNSPYGLGASVWTNNETLGKKILPQLEAGNTYLNEVVRGNPKLPFGGIKRTGFGREFSEHGLYEFVNIKSVVIG